MSTFLNISTDTTLGGNSPSDMAVSSQKAIKTYIDNNSGSTYSAGTGISISDNTISVDGVQTSEVELATVATSGSYNDLSNKPTIPTVNNATLTIQKNGTTVQTFTANASSDVTANITVPTNTNELTNGAGFITSSALSGYQTTANLVTSVSSSSTDSQYPSAKLFYDTVGDIESALNTINSGGGIQTVNLTVSLTGEPSYFQSITIDGVTYTSSSFTNNSMTVQIPKDTNVTWSATAVYSGYPLSGTLNESTDTTLSIHIYSGGGKD